MKQRVTESDATAWVARYVDAWGNNDPDGIGALFSPEAVYRTGPFDEPILGRDAIVEDWLDRRDEPGTWGFRSDILAVTGDLAVVRGTTTYSNPPAEYANLWLIRFGEATRCRDFTEWFIRRPEE
jgi:ketosteroid isomerase-like protein